MGDPGTRPPAGPNSSNFMQFLGKNWSNDSFSHLPLELALPPRGNPGSATGQEQGELHSVHPILTPTDSH